MNIRIILISVGAIVFFLLLYTFFSNRSQSEETVVPEVTTFPELKGVLDSTTGLPARINLSAQNNLSFEVYNFPENGETIEDPSNEDYYVLAGDVGYCLPDGTCPIGYDTDSFSVSYNAVAEYFTLVILDEPIAVNRKRAEDFLMSRLGIGEQEMCQLHYSFSAPYWVNEFYAGRELGFSFCPGSVSLE